MPTRRRKGAVPVPNLHFIMIVVVFATLVICLILSSFVAPDRVRLYEQVSMILIGLLGGKLSNSFGKPIDTAPSAHIERPGERDDEDSEVRL